jgi:hypothetical protein
MKGTMKSTQKPIAPLEQANVKRTLNDRRDSVDRRILDMGPGYPGTEARISIKERRRGWEDRYGWERVSRWSSSPVYPDLP